MRFTLGGTVIGVIMIAIGTYLISDAYNLNHKVLFLGWAERKWGPGSGTLAYKIIGMVLIGFAFLIITGLFNPFANPLDTLGQNGASNNGESTQNFTGGSSVQLSN
jgi:hypothetical protein